MLDTIVERLRKVRTIARGGALAATFVQRSGLLRAISPSGMVEFARRTRGMKPGPHLSLMFHAANTPEKLALAGGGRRFTFGQFDREINRLAQALTSLGVRPGDRIALMMPNCVEYVVAQEALPRIGATGVQIGYQLKAKEIAYILENARPTTVLCAHEFEPQMTAAREFAGGPDDSQLVTVRAAAEDDIIGSRYETLLAEFDGHKPPMLKGADAGGVIIYTSGTTGKPKGAERSFAKTGLESVLDFIMKIGMNHDDRHLVVCPLYHSAAPAFVKMMYSIGASVILADHFDPEGMLALIERERITSAFMVPTMLSRLAALDRELHDKYDTSSLKWVVSGAAPLPTETAKRFQTRFGPLLWNFYGATETGLVTLAGPSDHSTRPGTVGRALRGNELRVLDENGQLVAPGEIGELYARNSMLISGYHGNEGATQDSMRDGFFSVGDLARIDTSGYVFMASRKHDMVISGGVNIYPREIEDHIVTHPDVIEAAVIGVPDPDWGETLKAFVVRRNGSNLTAEDIVEFCRQDLADYKQPRRVEFLDELPRNPTGKVLKRELRER